MRPPPPVRPAGMEPAEPRPAEPRVEPDRESAFRRFLLQTLTVALVAALLFLAWTARNVLLLAVAVIVIAVLLDAPTRVLERRTPLPRRWALTATGVALGAIIGAFVWLMGAQVQSQVSMLVSAVTEAVQMLERRIGLPFIGGDTELFGGGAAGDASTSWTDLARTAARWGLTIAGALAAAVLVVVGGFFLAADPDVYRRGLVKLFPKDRHGEAEMALNKTGLALRQWLVAELIAMTIVGVLAGVGTWAIGLGAPLALGLFAGLAEFIPIVGPFIGAVPALLIAASQSWTTFLWTALLFVAIQQLESNVITPIVQRREVTIPPALLLLAVFFFGLLFGALGVIVAAPLTIILYVLVRELYVRRTLGERLGE